MIIIIIVTIIVVIVIIMIIMMILLWLLSWPILLYIYIYKCVYHVIASFISHDVPISNGWIFHWRVISQVIFSVDFTWQWTMDNPNWLSTKHRYAKPTMCRSCSLETGDPGDPGETKTIFMSIYWMIFQKHPNIISKWLRVCICIFVCGTMYIYIYICIYIYIYMCDGQNSIHVVRSWHRFIRPPIATHSPSTLFIN